MSSIAIENLDVVFGKKPAEALALMDAGKTRQEIIDLTGNVVGVHGASLTVHPGEICVLMGLSGSGKSSLLRAVNGLNDITRGSLKICDGDHMVDIAQCDQHTLRHLRSERVSMVFQKFALMPWLTVLDNVAFGLEMQNINKTERRRQAMEKLEMVGLAEWHDKLPHELSGGMQQRVGLARAFAMDTDILLMDEPFSALDPLIRAQLQDELIELQQQLNKTILFVSHDLDEALKIGSHIAIMESAHIIQLGRPEDIVLHPNNSYVEEFVAHTNPLNVLCGRSLMTPLTDLTSSAAGYELCRQNQSHFRLDNSGALAEVTQQQTTIQTQHWDKAQPLDSVRKDRVVICSPDIGMREAIELRYRSGRPLLLEERGSIVGALRDRDFYHALLGKHFTQDEVAH